MQEMSLKEKIIETAKQFEADLVCFGSAERFKGTRVMEIFPETRTVICLAFRVLRGVYRGIEEGTTYYQYSTNGVEIMEETVIPRALLRVSAVLEDAGYLGLPQRRHQCVMEAEQGHNFEMHYEEIYHDRVTEPQMDFEDAAVRCGLGERGLHGTVLTKKFGPMQRYAFVLTDAEIEETPLAEKSLCDHCRACIEACPGHAIDENGVRDVWQCGPYYRGARLAKNPFMPPNAFEDIEDREAVMAGEKKLTPEESIRVMEECIFYPPIKQGYASSICGRACDMACYIHLEKEGKLERAYDIPFRIRPDWKLDKVE